MASIATSCVTAVLGAVLVVAAGVGTADSAADTFAALAQRYGVSATPMTPNR